MVKSINIKGHEYSTLANLCHHHNISGVSSGIQHFEAHNVDYMNFRITLDLEPSQRLALGLNTASKRTILYDVKEASKWLTKPRPPKSSKRRREIPPTKPHEFEPRRFL
jgi:hypothetical protein